MRSATAMCWHSGPFVGPRKETRFRGISNQGMRSRKPPHLGRAERSILGLPGASESGGSAVRGDIGRASRSAAVKRNATAPKHYRLDHRLGGLWGYFPVSAAQRIGLGSPNQSPRKPHSGLGSGCGAVLNEL